MSRVRIAIFSVIYLASLTVLSDIAFASDHGNKPTRQDSKDNSKKEAKGPQKHTSDQEEHGSSNSKNNIVCVFKDDSGIVQKANSKKEVPSRFRSKAECRNPREFNNLASPDEMDVDGSEQKATVATPLGRIEARLARGASKYFKRMPTKALSDAAQAVHRGLAKGAFPRELRNTDFPWKVVFLDKNLPETQIPLELISNCNPAWMTPPANIYVIAQRVAGECNGQGAIRAKGVTDSNLAEILVHEMGHVVEFQLLKGKNPGTKDQARMRAEGFATWFTGFASGYSTVVEKDVVARNNKTQAAREIRKNPDEFNFEGTAGDYARASMYFQAVQDRKGTAGILAAYDLMANNDYEFFGAVQEVTGWSRQELEKQVPKATMK